GAAFWQMADLSATLGQTAFEYSAVCGARRLRRFTTRKNQAGKLLCVPELRLLKRAEARAPISLNRAALLRRIFPHQVAGALALGVQIIAARILITRPERIKHEPSVITSPIFQWLTACDFLRNLCHELRRKFLQLLRILAIRQCVTFKRASGRG